MNKIILMGRFIKKPELQYTETGKKVYTRFVIAVQRNFKLRDGSREADFVPIKVWGKKAEIICKYVNKGDYLTVSGSLRISSYEDKDSIRRYSTEVIAEDFKFISIQNHETQLEESGN